MQEPKEGKFMVWHNHNCHMCSSGCEGIFDTESEAIARADVGEFVVELKWLKKNEFDEISLLPVDKDLNVLVKAFGENEK